MRLSEQMQAMLRWTCCAFVAIGAGGCGSTAKSDDAATVVDDTAEDSGKPPKDIGTDASLSDGSDDSGPDIQLTVDVDAHDAPDVPPADVQIDPNLCTTKAAGYQPGDCGSPCTTGASCAYNLCVTTRDNAICSMGCGDAACPIGWVCTITSNGSDNQYGCVPSSPNLGKPCASDDDCKGTVAGTGISIPTGLGDYCVSFGDEGSFCGAACDGGQICPTGFTCQQVKTVGGGLAQQCAVDKTQLDLNCTKRFEVAGYATTCAITNSSGHCLGKRHCDSGALTKCDAQTPAPETCNNVDDNCNGLTDEPTPGATCSVFANSGTAKCPGKPFCAGGIETCVGTAPQPESCNGVDDDCNGQTDEGCDDDGDGYCDAAMGYEPGTLTCKKGGNDCDDTNAAIHPKAPEICDGLDNDCNGFADALDPGLPLTDPQFCANQLGICGGSMKPISLCQGGVWQACSPSDYKKFDGSYSSTEICDDKDNNCNGAIDEGCDDDKDGFCDSNYGTLGFPLSCPKGGGDCDDTNSKTHPGAPELCDDLDENCNGVVDEGCDKDKDGWCDAGMTTFGGPKVCPAGGGDCNDNNPDIRPDANEKCNGIDDDCNGATDETWPDLGYVCNGGKGQCAVKGITVCKADGSSSTCSIQPGLPQTEICDNLDNDCNGATDEGCDDDGDGYCDANMGAIGHPNACGYGPGDCDDTNVDVHPGAKEICDNVDNDCDGKTDADDGDIINDDPQVCENQKGACAGSKKYATMCKGGIWAKCDAPQYLGWNIFYSAVENCDNMDNNCDGVTDETCDQDGDGYCGKTKVILGAPTVCTTLDPISGQKITHTNDCDDNNAADFPGNVEMCDNQDNNCNNQVDEGCDKDLDGYCDVKMIIPTKVGKPDICKSGGNDCNDDPKAGGVSINPGEPETCFDGIDNNCDGQTDENCNWYFPNVQQIGPDYSSQGWFQCAGYQDIPLSNDIPDSGWGSYCANAQWKHVRIACGQKPAAGALGADWPVLRSIDLSNNVFMPGALQYGVEYGAIIKPNNFTPADSASILQSNLLTVFTAPGDSNSYALDYTRSWIGDETGWDETHWNLIVNNSGSPWEAANCFGLALWDNSSTPNLTNARALLVYVSR